MNNPNPTRTVVFVLIDGERRGPYGFDALQAEIKDGRIRLSDLGWCEGQSDWKPLRILLGEPQGPAESPAVSIQPRKGLPSPTRGKSPEQQNAVETNVSQTEAPDPEPTVRVPVQQKAVEAAPIMQVIQALSPTATRVGAISLALLGIVGWATLQSALGFFFALVCVFAGVIWWAVRFKIKVTDDLVAARLQPAAARTKPILGAVFLGIAIFIRFIYPWVRDHYLK